MSDTEGKPRIGERQTARTQRRLKEVGRGSRERERGDECGSTSVGHRCIYSVSKSRTACTACSRSPGMLMSKPKGTPRTHTCRRSHTTHKDQTPDQRHKHTPHDVPSLRDPRTKREDMVSIRSEHVGDGEGSRQRLAHRHTVLQQTCHSETHREGHTGQAERQRESDTAEHRGPFLWLSCAHRICVPPH